MKTRENTTDFLRIIACIMVITIHVSAFYVIKYADNLDFRFTIGNFYDSLARPAVPIFVLLAGRFALSNEKNIDVKYYYKKFFKNIFTPTMIWSVLYFLFSYVLIFLSHIILGKSPKSIYSPIIDFIKGAPYFHLWYLYMCIGLYLLVPYLIRLKKKIGEEKFLKMGIIFFILGLFIFLFEVFLSSINFYERNDIFRYLKYFWYFNHFKFISFLGYFILGYSLKDFKNKYTSFKNMIVLAFIFLILLFFTVEFVARNGILDDFEKINRIYNNNFIFVMGASISIYLGFNSLDSKKIKFDFRNLAFHSFNIYLVHAGILHTVQIILEKIFNYIPNPIWGIPFMIVFIFIASYIFSIILEKIKDRLKNK